MQPMFLGIFRGIARQSSTKSGDRYIADQRVVGNFSWADRGLGPRVSKYHFGDRFSSGNECVIERAEGGGVDGRNRTIITKYKELIAHPWW